MEGYPMSLKRKSSKWDILVPDQIWAFKLINQSGTRYCFLSYAIQVWNSCWVIHNIKVITSSVVLFTVIILLIRWDKVFCTLQMMLTHFTQDTKLVSNIPWDDLIIWMFRRHLIIIISWICSSNLWLNWPTSSIIWHVKWVKAVR